MRCSIGFPPMPARSEFSDLAPEDAHAMKQRIIDTFGALLGGFFSETCQIARNLAARMPCPDGATIIGTRNRTTPDMAAFVNSTTSREVEMNDVYFSILGGGAHPSDVTLPILAAAEGGATSGKELIAAVTLAYEVYMQISDARAFPGSTSPCWPASAPRSARARSCGWRMRRCSTRSRSPSCRTTR